MTDENWQLEQRLGELESKVESHSWGLWILLGLVTGAIIFPFLTDLWYWITSWFGFY